MAFSLAASHSFAHLSASKLQHRTLPSALHAFRHVQVLVVPYN
jgi:hypothetical protein